MGTINRISFSKFGGPEVLTYGAGKLGKPRKGEVQIAVEAIGVNFIDTYQRTGLYPVTLPYVPGGEMSGRVVALGSSVADFKVGDLVACGTAAGGCYAQLVNVSQDRLVKVPKGISAQQAAALMLKGMTAQYLLRQVYRVGPEDTILVHAAAGGVGQIMTQWASALGVCVIGTVSTAAKAKIARSNGCEHVINYATQDFVKAVNRITKSAKLPVVYDSVGAATFPASLDVLQPFGLFVSYGNASGPVPPFSPGLLAQKGSLFMTRPTLFDFVRTPQMLKKVASEVFRVVKQGKVVINIGARYPLSEAAQAHSDLEQRLTCGSIILVP